MTPDATELSLGVLDQLVAGGLLYAIPLFIISLLLFVEGSKRIPLTVGIVGFLVGFGLVGEVYEFLGANPPLSEGQFRLIAAAGVGVISVSVAQIAMRFLAAALVFLIITNLINTGTQFDMDFEGDAFLSGVLTLTAFFLSMSFRRLVPALMAGMVGTLGMMLAVYVGLGWPVERLDGVSAPDAYLALVGMFLSAYLQWQAIKKKEEAQEEGEKEYYDF